MAEAESFQGGRGVVDLSHDCLVGLASRENRSVVGTLLVGERSGEAVPSLLLVGVAVVRFPVGVRRGDPRLLQSLLLVESSGDGADSKRVQELSDPAPGLLECCPA